MKGPPSPHPLFAIGSGFMGAQLLLTAVELDVFAALGADGRTLVELADALRVPEDALRLLLDGLVALELLERRGARYVNTAVTEAYLTGGGADDLRSFFRYWRRHSYGAWAHLTEALRDERVPSGWQSGWLDAVAATRPEAARPLCRAPELTDGMRVLVTFDASASVLSAILHAHPRSTATLAERATAHPRLHAALDPLGLTDRVTLLATDPLAGPFAGAHDAAVVVHALHLQSPARNQRLLHHLGQALVPGAPLLLVDHWLDESRTRPAFAAVSAAELFLATGEGRNYGVDEVRSWLASAELELVEHRPLVGPASVIVARRPAL